MYAINFYTPVYEDAILRGRKTVTIRLGDKSDKYRPGQLVWITVGQRYGRRRRLFAAILDAVEVKLLANVSPREIDRESPEMRDQGDLCDFLSRIYDRQVTPADTVTVVHFSPVEEE